MSNDKDELDFESDLDVEAERTHQMVVNLEGFEGPLDLLLMLARAQKVDLAQISILPLVEQYLAFIAEARRLSLEVAADYLVMAAWLAYLKSRLLLPEEDEEGEPSAEELAMRLQLQLQRLNAMRESGAKIMSRERLGRDVFGRGAPENIVVERKSAYDVTLYELLKAYAHQRVKGDNSPYHIPLRPIYSLEEAVHRLSKLIGETFEWTDLYQFLPDDGRDSDYRRSSIASMFAAGLELAKEGTAEIRQLETYGPLLVKKRNRKD